MESLEKQIKYGKHSELEELDSDDDLLMNRVFVLSEEKRWRLMRKEAKIRKLELETGE